MAIPLCDVCGQLVVEREFEVCEVVRLAQQGAGRSPMMRAPNEARNVQ